MSADWMFSPNSGYLLDMQPGRGVAACPVSGYSRELSDLTEVKLVRHTDMEDFQRRYDLDMLVKTREAEMLLEKRQHATVDEVCPKCKTRGLDFYTMQLRSADEGQTVFYECKACGHKSQQNN